MEVHPPFKRFKAACTRAAWAATSLLAWLIGWWVTVLGWSLGRYIKHHQTTQIFLRSIKVIKSVKLVHWSIMAEFLEATLLLPKLKLEKTSKGIANYLIMSLSLETFVRQSVSRIGPIVKSSPKKKEETITNNIYWNTWCLKTLRTNRFPIDHTPDLRQRRKGDGGWKPTIRVSLAKKSQVIHV